MVPPNPFHHSSTVNAETGITGIKDDTRHKLFAIQAHLFVYKKLFCPNEYLKCIIIDCTFQSLLKVYHSSAGKEGTGITEIKDYY